MLLTLKSRALQTPFTRSLRYISLKLPSSCTTALPAIKSANNVVFPTLPGPFSSDRDAKLRCYSSFRQDNPFDSEILVPLTDSDKQILGFLRPHVVQALKRESWNPPFELRVNSYHEEPFLISFTQGMNRTACIERIVRSWKQKNLFPDVLRGWSDEKFPVYEPGQHSRLAFSIERAALPLFGLPNYGCLMVAYFVLPETKETFIWVPRRSKNKRTWPGKLDVTVGGGIGSHDTPLSTIIRESTEEASFDPNFVSSTIKPTGVVALHNRSPSGWLLPGLYYMFDLPLPPDNSIRPKVNDGEVETFELMSAQQVLENIVAGEFKSSSALGLMDFFIRHGLFTADTDPCYATICFELRKSLHWGQASLGEQ